MNTRIQWRWPTVALLVLAIIASAARVATAQGFAPDATGRLRQVLPADVASRVFATIARARAKGLPAEALENRALKFAARGVDGPSIDKAISEQADRMERVRDALQTARNRRPADDEIEAGAEAMRKGIDAQRVAQFARSAPGDRSLAVPLYVIGSLRDQGLPLDSAVRRVEQKLSIRASDRDIEKMAVEPSAPDAGPPGPETGRALGKTKDAGAADGRGRGPGGGGPPAAVPGNGGKKATPPGIAKKPEKPGKKP